MSARTHAVSLPTRLPRARGRTLASVERLARNPGALVGVVVLLLMVMLALAAPLFITFDPEQMRAAESLKAPSLAHPFGTDRLGRDVLARVAYGARLSLWAAFVATLIGALLGVVPGMLAGYWGRWVDALVMRMVDVLLAFPGILLALAIIAVLGNGLPNVMVAVGVSLIPSFVRLSRALTLVAKGQLYVEAARCIGCGDAYIIFRHILPNIIAPVLILSTVTTAWAVIIAASLNFLGMGVQPPTPEWGADLAAGRDHMHRAWWIVAFPGGAIALTLLAINLAGDGLREVLDPRFRVR